MYSFDKPSLFFFKKKRDKNIQKGEKCEKTEEGEKRWRENPLGNHRLGSGTWLPLNDHMPQASPFTFLSLSFLICTMGTIKAALTVSQHYW